MMSFRISLLVIFFTFVEVSYYLNFADLPEFID